MTDTEAILDTVCAQVGKLTTLGAPPRRMRIQVGEVSVEVEWPALDAGLSGAVPTAPTAAPEPEPETEPGHREVRAPLIGTFYRAPEPGAPPFVQPGDRVRPGQQIGIIEAMKLMNPIEAAESGIVARVLVEDGSAVEFDQPLLLLAAESGTAT